MECDRIEEIRMRLEAIGESWQISRNVLIIENMIVRVQGRDRIMRIETSEGFSVEELIKEVNRRTGSVCTSLRMNGSQIARGTLKENKIENGALIEAEYEVVQKDAGAVAERKIAKKGCLHGPEGMCPECAPEDSWNSASFENRRFISQKAYEEYLASQGKTLSLESHVATPCKTHPVGGKCNQCMERELAVTRQTFRPVDHVEIHDKAILEKMISEYIGQKTQSVALLIGRYSDYAEVAKGVKAEVFCSVEVEQKKLKNGFLVNPNDKILRKQDKAFSKVLEYLKMEVVGMVYTRISEKKLPFISSLEAEFIGKMQNMFGYAEGGVEKGSRFVTLIVSGTPASQEVVELSATNLAMELLRDGMVCASKRPEEMEMVSVPAVWTDREGMKRAHRVPVEYFVVRPTHGLTAGKGIFTARQERQPFKRGAGISALKKHIQKRVTEQSVERLSLGTVSDFQVLLELADLEIVTKELVECVLEKDEAKFVEGVLEGKYARLVEIAKECKEATKWACEVCTLENPSSNSACEACGIPKGQ